MSPTPRAWRHVQRCVLSCCDRGGVYAGCIGGAGNPRASRERLSERQRALYSIDERMELRQSHENPAVQYLYASFLGEPGSDVAHRLLHTHYVPGGAPAVVKSAHDDAEQK